MDAIVRACSIYCIGSLLYYVQTTQLYPDSKTFVDMPMRYDPEIINNNFMKWLLVKENDPTNTTMLLDFINAHFDEVGSDLITTTPDDYNKNPEFLNNINNKKYKKWAKDLNDLWLVLGRRVSDDVYIHPQRHSFLPRKNIMIVPGGRFR